MAIVVVQSIVTAIKENKDPSQKRQQERAERALKVWPEGLESAPEELTDEQARTLSEKVNACKSNDKSAFNNRSIDRFGFDWSCLAADAKMVLAAFTQKGSLRPCGPLSHIKNLTRLQPLLTL